MINIVYIEKELLFSQESCDDFCGKQVNRVRQRDRHPFVTNTSRVANVNHSGYTAQLLVGRVLGEDELVLAEETQFIARGNVLDKDQLIEPIRLIVADAGFDVEFMHSCIYDESFDFTSFVFPSTGRLNDIVTRSDGWKSMPKAHESWEDFKC